MPTSKARVEVNGMPLLGITSTLLMVGIGLGATTRILVLMVQ